MNPGLIVSPNSDPTSLDLWAMIINLVVVNIVTCDYNNALSIIINDNVDYMVNLSVSGQTGVTIGSIYTPSTNSFTTPS